MLGLAAATTLLVVAGCSAGNAEPHAEAPAASPVPVNVVQPVRSDIFATYKATATVYSDVDAPVSARVGGQVVEILAEEGEQVEQGQLLARVDGERLRLQMLSARADLERANREYERNVNLHERGLISSASFESLKYDLDALRATYELHKLNYSYASIRAPIAGIVSARNIKPGQNINAGDIAFRITDTSELRAELHIPQSELAKFSPGHLATLTIDAMPDAVFEASILRLSPTIDVRNGTFRATAVVDNRAGQLAPGMFARFAVAYEKHENALLVPREAIVEEDNQTSVFVVLHGEVVQRTVRTGITTDEHIEVVAGLELGESVVVQGQSSLRSGTKVLASTRQPDGLTG